MIAAWWNGLQPRERQMVSVGAVVVALLLGWSFIWFPLSRARTELHARVERERADVAWMRQASAQAAELHSTGGHTHVSRDGKSLLALADATARASGLSGALKRVEPTGGNSVRVSFEVASFDMMVDWMTQLARDYGVRVSDMSAEKVEGLGLVNARITLEDTAR